MRNPGQTSSDVVPRIRTLLDDVSKSPEAKTVHKLRTSLRRMEALLKASQAVLSKGDSRALSLIEAVRKRSGKTRDLDVQLELASSLPNGDRHHPKHDLIDALEAERERRAQKLSRAAEDVLPEISGKRWKRLSALVEEPNVATADLDGAYAKLRALETEFGVTAGKMKRTKLHDLRIGLKHLRYLLEFAEPTVEVEHLVEGLKAIHSAVGEWHDWETLERSAEKLLPTATEELLRPQLRTHTASKFQEAMAITKRVFTDLLLPAKKGPAPASRAATHSRTA